MKTDYISEKDESLASPYLKFFYHQSYKIRKVYRISRFP